MVTHLQIWRALDALAARYGTSPSGLAKLAGLEPYHITRCFQADPQLKQLHEIANDPEQLIRFGRR